MGKSNLSDVSDVEFRDAQITDEIRYVHWQGGMPQNNSAPSSDGAIEVTLPAGANERSTLRCGRYRILDPRKSTEIVGSQQEKPKLNGGHRVVRITSRAPPGQLVSFAA